LISPVTQANQIQEGKAYWTYSDNVVVATADGTGKTAGNSEDIGTGWQFFRHAD